jgi:ArsR family transcriptional regulator
VRALRADERSDFFEKLGLRWDVLREDCFGPTFHLEAFLHLLPREWTVADLGTGTGYLLPTLAAHFRRVVGVDASGPMLELARQRVAQAARPHGRTNIVLRQGTLEALPLADREADLAVALLMLHHLAEIEPALRETHRILKPGGRLLLVEIHPYDNERFRVAMGDRRAGVDPKVISDLLSMTGFSNVENWRFQSVERPEHELAPIPTLYGISCSKE